MIDHPLLGNLTEKSDDDLIETINTLSKNMQFMFRIGKHDMVRQIQMALTTYREEYFRRQAEVWNKKSEDLDGKIDIS